MRNSPALRQPHGGALAVLLTVIALVATAVFVHVVPVHSTARSTHVVTVAEPDAAPSNIAVGDARSQAADPGHSQIDHDSTLRHRAPDLTGADVGTLPASAQHVLNPTINAWATNDPVTASSVAPPSLIALSINRT